MQALAAALVLLVAAAARAQTPGVIANTEQRVLVPYYDAQGVSYAALVGYALERFDGAQWVELVRANGQRAIAQGGGMQCWRVPDRTRATSYRLRPQIYDAPPNGTMARPIDCAAPTHTFAPPACPAVVPSSLWGGSCLSWAIMDVVDPGGAPGKGPPAAPVVQ